MNLYVMDYWVPFPSSEYGGLFIFAANSEDEVRELAWEATSEFDRASYGKGVVTDTEVVLIGRTDLYDTPQIVDAFST